MTLPEQHGSTYAPRVAKLAAGLSLLALAAVVGLTGTPQRQPARIVVGRAWAADELVPLSKIDHSAWDRQLRTYVDESGNVNYVGWNDTPRDVAELDGYL